MVVKLDELRADIGPILTTKDTYLSTLYLDLVTSESIDAFLDAPESPFLRTKRGSPGVGWKGIPSVTNIKKPLYKPLLSIIQDVREAFLTEQGTSFVASRVVRDTHHTRMRYENGLKMRPDFVVVAEGSSFEVPHRSSPSFPGVEDVGYTNVATVFEVRREKSRGTDEENVTQIGLHCQQIFLQQPNREFVRALLITEQMVQLVHYDRSGTYITPPLNYHSEPHTFVRLILGLTSTDETVLGFDNTVRWEIENGRKVSGTITLSGTGCAVAEGRKPIVYHLKGTKPSFSRPSICGRGTTCWLVQQPGGKDLIIKDAWRTGSRLPEHEYLEAARGIPGIVQMISYEYLGEASDHRPTAYAGDPVFQDRRKLRIVMEAHGSVLEQFKSRYQFVAALRHAIRAHRNLYSEAHVLHRDISVLNILLGDGDDTLDGFLIDMDMAVFYKRPADISAQAKTGTRNYQSIAVLQSYDLEPGQPIFPHGYLDDLESFFYVLCDIMFNRFSIGTEIDREAKKLLDQWGSSNGLQSKIIFTQFTLDSGLIDVDFWGTACAELLKDFHGFMKAIIYQKETIRVKRATREEKARLLKEMEADGKVGEYYDAVDALLKKALVALETEEPEIEARLAARNAARPVASKPTPVLVTSASPNPVPRRVSKTLLKQVEDVETAEPPAKRRSTRNTRPVVPFGNLK